MFSARDQHSVAVAVGVVFDVVVLVAPGIVTATVVNEKCTLMEEAGVVVATAVAGVVAVVVAVVAEIGLS